MSPKRKIPEGWVGCPAMSTGFIDDRFFVFKTPLKPDLNGKVPETERFAINDAVEEVKRMNNSQIGLWIDLTNTNRYYDACAVTSLGIEYKKLSCEGHGEPPSESNVQHFCDTVDQFLRSNRHNYVGVHCTHGFNRTGFLICSYLIRYRRYSAAEAVMEFAKFRAPGIYRQNYVNCLYNINGPSNLPPIRVTQPHWLMKGGTSSGHGHDQGHGGFGLGHHHGHHHGQDFQTAAGYSQVQPSSSSSNNYYYN